MFEARIHGRGGQGVVTGAELLSTAAFFEGRHAQAFPSFGSERTGVRVVAFCRISRRSAFETRLGSRHRPIDLLQRDGPSERRERFELLDRMALDAGANGVTHDREQSPQSELLVTRDVAPLMAPPRRGSLAGYERNWRARTLLDSPRSVGSCGRESRRATRSGVRPVGQTARRSMSACA